MIAKEEEEEKLSATAQRFCRRFSLHEIQLATQDFSEDHLIGIGGFGKVYKAQLDNREESVCVAVKRLAANSNQGESEFLTEIETLSKLRHINLVSLIGYCNDNGEMILVYEYIPRGTLANNLYKLSRSSDSDNDGSSFLTWKQRLNICIGAARGLDYLHTGTSIIHRDVKSTNILLDENFRAKVSDFGLAKHLSTVNPQTHISTVVKGSFGYLDPSYFTTYRLTRQSDTYAFGVVLLEVLCGRPAVDPRLGEDEMGLVLWAQQKMKKGKVEQIVASNLKEVITPDCLKTFVGIAKHCLNQDPKKRPTMGNVLGKLELALEQQDRKAQSLIAFSFQSFWSSVKPFGSLATGSTLATQEDSWKDEQSSTTVDEANNVAPLVCAAIPVHELKNMTHNFSSECLICERSSSRVYRGVLKSGQVVAIMELIDNHLPDNKFLQQVSITSNLKHENVALLLGYCVADGQHFLAYEFAQNGTLHNILHRRKGHIKGTKAVRALSWDERVKIALGVAKGLEYLHQKKLIHRNIKSSNILLFDDYNLAKLSDFGWFTLSTDPLDDDTGYYHPGAFQHHRGYHPPECIRFSELSWRTDVYSFGVLLLELLTGREVYDSDNKYQHIVKWATPWLGKDEIKWVVDARLIGAYPPEAASKMAEVARMCVQAVNIGFRPKMDTVIRALHPLLNATSA